MSGSKLPKGCTCGNCLYFERKCSWLLSRQGDEVRCDWALFGLEYRKDLKP